MIDRDWKMEREMVKWCKRGCEVIPRHAKGKEWRKGRCMRSIDSILLVFEIAS